MHGSIGTVAAGAMEAFHLGMVVAANNIANKKTFAFSTQRPIFVNQLYHNLQVTGTPGATAGRMNPVAMQLGTGVHVAAIDRDLSMGDPEATGGKYDFYISGTGIGYFKVQLPDENRGFGYKRAGTFAINKERQLVTLEGGYLLEDSISFPDQTMDVSVNELGEVFAQVAGEDKLQQVGQLKLYTFPNPKGLEHMENGLLLATEISGDEISGTPGSKGFGTIKQGHLETSNVRSIKQVIDMTDYANLYSLCAEFIKAQKDIQKSAVNVAS